jgi:hypothetical protein
VTEHIQSNYLKQNHMIQKNNHSALLSNIISIDSLGYAPRRIENIEYALHLKQQLTQNTGSTMNYEHLESSINNLWKEQLNTKNTILKCGNKRSIEVLVLQRNQLLHELKQKLQQLSDELTEQRNITLQSNIVAEQYNSIVTNPDQKVTEYLNNYNTQSNSLLNNLNVAKQAYEDALEKLNQSSSAYLECLQQSYHKIEEFTENNTKLEANSIALAMNSKHLRMEAKLRKIEKMQNTITNNLSSSEQVIAIWQEKVDTERELRILHNDIDKLKLEDIQIDAFVQDSLSKKEKQIPILKQKIEAYKDQSSSYFSDMLIENKNTLSKWMNTSRTLTETLSMITNIAHTIYSLNQNGVSIKSLSSDNIIIGTSGTSSIILTETLHQYISPESSGSLPTDKSFGIILLVLLNENNSSSLDNRNLSKTLRSELQHDKLIHTFLEDLLCDNPEKRLDIIAAIRLIDVLFQQYYISTRPDAVQALYDYLVQIETHSVYQVPVKLNNIVSSTLSVFKSITGPRFKQKLSPIFEGTITIDSWLDRFFTAITTTRKLLEPIAGYRTLVSSHNTTATEEEFEILGKIVSKIIYDRHKISFKFAPYILRFLLLKSDNESLLDVATVQDLQLENPDATYEITSILKNQDITSLCLDYNEIEPGNETSVTETNVRHYTARFIQHKLIDHRLLNLQAMRRGFRSITHLLPYYNLLNYVDLEHILYNTM